MPPKKRTSKSTSIKRKTVGKRTSKRKIGGSVKRTSKRKSVARKSIPKRSFARKSIPKRKSVARKSTSKNVKSAPTVPGYTIIKLVQNTKEPHLGVASAIHIPTNKKVGITFNTNKSDALKRLEKVKKMQPFIE